MAEGDGVSNVVYLSKGRVNLTALRQAIEEGQDIQDFNQVRKCWEESVFRFVSDGLVHLI